MRRPAPTEGSLEERRRAATVASECLRLRLPRLAEVPLEVGFLEQVSLQPEIPGSHLVRYEGLQGLLVRRAERRFRSLWQDHLESLIEADQFTRVQALRARTRQEQAYADHALGRWWDRSWQRSLPAAKGGAPAEAWVHTIGARRPVFAWGPLTLSNDARLRVARIGRFSLDPDPPAPLVRRVHVRATARDRALLARSSLDPDDPQQLTPAPRLSRAAKDEQRALGLDVSAEDQSWLDTAYWRLRLRPRAKVRVGSKGLSGELALRASAALFAGSHLLRGQRVRRQWADFEVEARWRPVDGEVQISARFALVTW